MFTLANALLISLPLRVGSLCFYLKLFQMPEMLNSSFLQPSQATMSPLGITFGDIPVAVRGIIGLFKLVATCRSSFWKI